METYGHVAVAVEDSPGSHKALQEAARMASLTGARLSVLHVTSIPMPPPYMGEGGVFLPDPEVMQAAALTWLKEMVEGIPGAQPQVLEGHPPDAVCQWAEENDVDLLVAHQANERILDHASERMGIAREKVVMNLDRVGNTSSASIPLAMADARDRGLLDDGAVVLMVGFGAGLTWGSVLVRWEPRA